MKSLSLSYKTTGKSAISQFKSRLLTVFVEKSIGILMIDGHYVRVYITSNF